MSPPNHSMQRTGKQQSSLQEYVCSLSTVSFVLRATLAVSLLIVLVGAGLVLPAAASGPMCTLACCAGRAPHVAGSCMQGSCATQPSDHHAHQGTDDSSSPIPGVVAGAHGADMEAVPTVDASESSREVARENSSVVPAFSTAALVKPCELGCGASMSIFSTGQKARDARISKPVNHRPPLASASLTRASFLTKATHPGFSRSQPPRGPPSC